MTFKFALPIAAALLLGGCVAPEDAKPEPTKPAVPDVTAQSPSATPQTAQTVPAVPPSAAASGGASAMPPMMGGDPMAPLSKTPELDKKIADAVKSGDKMAIATAYTERGNFRQKDEKAGARMKYRAALSDFRKALKANPKNTEALTFKQNIEEIYKSMGRPVPTEDVP